MSRLIGYARVSTDDQNLNLQIDALIKAGVDKSLIFTDGKLSAGYYETIRPSENSTVYLTNYSQIYIQPGANVIDFPAKSGGNYISVSESVLTNKLIGITQYNTDGTPQTFPTIRNNGVIHKINTVLLFDKLVTK